MLDDLKATRITSFEEFWPYYLGEHKNQANRILHYLGTLASLVYLLWCILDHHYLALLWLPVVSYGPAWLGHFVIERNKPATFTYPLMSLRADLKMFGMMLTGRLQSQTPIKDL